MRKTTDQKLPQNHRSKAGETATTLHEVGSPKDSEAAVVNEEDVAMAIGVVGAAQESHARVTKQSY
jgi:hypothetical protein